MVYYEPNMSFEEFMKRRKINAQTREEALSKEVIASIAMTDLALVKASPTDVTEPYRVGDVTADWLANVLGGHVPGAVLEEADVGDEHNGMADRKLMKLKWNDAGVEAGLPSSVFIKATPTLEKHRMLLACRHMGETEVHVYTKIHPELPRIVPKAYYARSYPGGRYLLLLQDLHELGCTPYWMAYDCSIEHARAVVTALAELHATYWESERFSTDLAWLRPLTHQYGWPMLEYLNAEARYIFLQTERGQSIPAQIRDLIQKWNEHDTEVYRYIEKQPCTMQHGDSHLGNTFSYPDGSAGYFDWQCSMRGMGIRDVTNFILSALTNDQRRLHEEELIDLYVAKLEEGGVRVDRELTFLQYCLLALDCLDRNLQTLKAGTYNHAEKGVLRRLECQIGSLMDHDVAALLDVLIRKGTL